jgi:hypothetical protein
MATRLVRWLCILSKWCLRVAWMIDPDIFRTESAKIMQKDNPQ